MGAGIWAKNLITEGGISGISCEGQHKAALWPHGSGDRLSRWRAGAFGPFAISQRITAKPPLKLAHEKWPKTVQVFHF